MDHIVIIGNGISGITAARWIRKLSAKKITVISSESKYFFSRTALMYVYMGHMRSEDLKPYEDWFWDKNNINLLQAHVESIDFDSKNLQLTGGEKIPYDKLILALGSKPNKFGWPGQDLKGVGGLYHWQDLERMEKYSSKLNHAVVVGGGLIGIEMAEMFHSRGIHVTMLVRESSYWSNILPKEESKMVSDHILSSGIDLRLGVNLQEIRGNDKGEASSVIIKETQEEIKCGFVGLTAGVSPNISWLKDTPLQTNRGIAVNSHLETNIDDVFAIGDCAELQSPNPGRRAIEAIWYTGRMMGETVAYNVCGKKVDYDPGLWFNSAKFIDIEYQVYGHVPAVLPENMKTLFWQSKDGLKSIRINYDAHDKKVLGFNLFGIRYRHEVCEKWIKSETHIEQVLTQLSLANFDPEFYQSYDHHLVSIYNKMENKNLSLSFKRGLSRVLSFLNQSK